MYYILFMGYNYTIFVYIQTLIYTRVPYLYIEYTLAGQAMWAKTYFFRSE